MKIRSIHLYFFPLTSFLDSPVRNLWTCLVALDKGLKLLKIVTKKLEECITDVPVTIDPDLGIVTL
jgi:hypothetical protein